MGGLSPEERELVRLAAVIAVADEGAVRDQLVRAHAVVRVSWIEEVILQSYLFAGFPRTLNAARVWRRVSGIPAPTRDDGERVDRTGDWRADGERTCARVYGAFYGPLRGNIRDLHPALDAWMIVEGYGKVLSRPELDLARRELCIVAVCAAARQDRQLHSHLHGALNAGASGESVTEALGLVADLVPSDDAMRHRLLWQRVRNRVRNRADVH